MYKLDCVFRVKNFVPLIKRFEQRRLHKSAMKLYGDMRSPCVRAVFFTAKILNIQFEYIPIDIFKQEQHAPEYIKMFPTHSVPALDDNGFLIWDSHAIMTYLAEKYGNNHSLYPLDIHKRTKINQMLYFESTRVFAMHRYIGVCMIRKRDKELLKNPINEVKVSYGYLNTFLDKSKYLIDNEMTLADLSVWTTLTNSQIYLPVDAVEFPRLAEYLKIMDSLPYGESNQKEQKRLKDLIKSIE